MELIFDDLNIAPADFTPCPDMIQMEKPQFPIPENKQDAVMTAFWSLLKLEEARAQTAFDKHLCEEKFKLWNSVTKQKHKPYWKK